MAKDHEYLQPAATARKPTFKHRRLDHSRKSVRLINVFPDLSPDGHVRCEIRHATTEANYQCLSYRWGEDAPAKPILIVDPGSGDPERPFLVTQPLHDFLHRFRRETALGAHAKTGVANLWIDAICIDQNHASERIHQVAQMDEVYARAYRVIVWLGETMGNDHNLVRRIRSLLKQPSTDPLNSLEQGDEATSYRSFLSQVCGNHYWNRAWITQEVVLAKRVYLLLLGRLIELTTFATQFAQDVPPRRILRLRQTMPCEPLRHRLPLLSLLNELRGRQCSRPFDRIFSILGLVNEWRKIEVNYDRSSASLAFEVLRACNQDLCLCSVLLVTQVLGADAGSREVGSDGPFVLIGCPGPFPSGLMESSIGGYCCPNLQTVIERCHRLSPSERASKGIIVERA